MKTLEQLKKELALHEGKLSAVLDKLDDKQKLKLFNEYAEACYHEERAFPMSELDYLVNTEGLSTTEILEKFDLKKFSLNEPVFWYDSTGDIVSGSENDFLEDYFYSSDIANWIKSEDYCIPNSVQSDMIDDWVEKRDDLLAEIEDLKDENKE